VDCRCSKLAKAGRVRAWTRMGTVIVRLGNALYWTASGIAALMATLGARPGADRSHRSSLAGWPRFLYVLAGR
jgi:hypothetical protein